MGQGLLGGLPRTELRLTVLVNAIDADSCWSLIILDLVRVALQLLHASATVALVVRVLHLINLFKCCVLTWAIQWALIASFGLLGTQVRAVDVRQCLAWVGSCEV